MSYNTITDHWYFFFQTMQENWLNGNHTLTRIECHSENSKGVYCLQYDEDKIVSGLRDNTIKVTSNCLNEQQILINAYYFQPFCSQ